MTFFAKNTPFLAFPFHLKLILLCLAGFILPQELLSQYRLHGKITYNNDPVTGATIIIKEDSVGVIKGFAISGAGGSYSADYRGKKTTIFLEVSMVGFIKIFIPLQLGQESEIELLFQLTRTDELLPEVIIKNEAAIMQRGDTIIFKIDSFITGAESSLAIALEKLPGLILGPGGKMVYNGKIIGRILIENDDLIGNNYGSTLEKLSIRGIDKVEIIKNYTDPDNIISSENEQVLNLKYKKGFLTRTFGEILLGQGFPFRYRSAGCQTLSLFKKYKILFLNETSNAILSATDYTYFQPSQPSSAEISLKNYFSLSTITDLRPSTFATGFQSERLNSGTKLGTRFKVSKNISMSGNIGINHLVLGQSTQTIRTFLLTQTPVTVNEIYETNKRTTAITPTFSINYLPNKKKQFIGTIGGEFNPFRFQNNANFQNLPQTENKKGQNGQFSTKAVFNRIFSRSFISLESNISILITNALYKNTGRTLAGFYGLPAGLTPAQNEMLTQFDWQSRFLYGSGMFSVLVNTWLVKSKIKSTIDFTDNQYHITIDNDSTIHSILVTRGLSSTFSYRPGIKKFMIKPSVSISYINNKLTNQFPAPVLIKREIMVLPELSIDYKINRENQFAFSYATGTVQPQAIASAQGLYINNLSALTAGAGQLNLNRTFTLSLSYFYNGLQKKSLLISTGIFFNKTPLLTIQNIHPGFYYTLNKTIVFDKNTYLQSYFCAAEKLKPGLIKRIALRINIYRVETYSVIENRALKNNSINFQPNLKLFFRNAKLNIITENEYHLIKQVIYSDIKILNNISKWNSSVSIEREIAGSLFFFTKLTSNFVFPVKQDPQKLLIADVRLSMLPKNKKWQLDMIANNLFNQNAFTVSDISTIQTQTSVYQIFPRIIMLQWKLKF